MSLKIEVIQFFFGIFRAIRIPTQWMEWLVYSVKTCINFIYFWFRPWCKTIRLYLRRNWVWISGRFEITSTFWKIQTISILTEGSDKCNSESAPPPRVWSFGVRLCCKNSKLYLLRNMNLKIEIEKNEPFFGTSGLSTFWTQEHNDCFFNVILL